MARVKIFLYSENAKLFINGVEVKNGQFVNIVNTDSLVFKANEGFLFESEIFLSDEIGSDVDVSFKSGYYNDDKTICTIPPSFIDDNWIDLTGRMLAVAVEGIPTPKPINHTLKLNLTNCNMFIDDIIVNTGQTVGINLDFNVIKFKADEGYFFDTPIYFENILGETVDYRLGLTGWNETFTEVTIARSFLEDDYFDEPITAVAKLIKVIPPEEPPENIVSDYIGIYNLTQTQLKELSNVRYEMMTGEGSSEYLDINEYIKNLYILPFNIDSEIDNLDIKINIANIVLDVYSKKIKNEVIKIKLGEINIPLEYNNAYDFLDTECYLYLPYTRKIMLEVGYVVGQVLNIEYIINTFTRETTINIYSTLTNNIVYTDNIGVGYKIPYVQQLNYDMLDSFKFNNYNKIDRPYIEIVRKKPYLSNFKNKDEYTTLLNKVGYYEIDKIDLQGKSTIQEKETIERILSRGFYIK